MYEIAPLGPFVATNDTYFLGDMTIAYANVTSQSYKRGRSEIRRDGFDHLALIVPQTGTAAGSVGDTSYFRAPGSMMFVDAAQPEQHVSSGNDCIIVTVDRDLARKHLPPIESLHGLIMSPRDAELSRMTLLDLRGRFSVLDQHSIPVVQQLVLNTLNVTLASAGRTSATSEQAGEETLPLRARRLIARNLGSTGLTVANLARNLGVSRATLQRAFHGGGGVETYVRAQRLAAVRAALANRDERRSIAALADAFGFSDGAHLSRLFRAQFGTSPSAYRAREIQG